MLVLVPDPDEPVVPPGGGEERPVRGVGQVRHRVGRAGLPQARPADGAAVAAGAGAAAVGVGGAAAGAAPDLERNA